MKTMMFATAFNRNIQAVLCKSSQSSRGIGPSQNLFQSCTFGDYDGLTTELPDSGKSCYKFKLMTGLITRNIDLIFVDVVITVNILPYARMYSPFCLF